MNAQMHTLGTWRPIAAEAEETLEGMRFQVLRANIESEVILIKNRDYAIFAMFIAMLLAGAVLAYVLVRTQTLAAGFLVSPAATAILLGLVGAAALASSIAAMVRLTLNQRHHEDLLRSLELQFRLRETMDMQEQSMVSGMHRSEGKQPRKAK